MKKTTSPVPSKPKTMNFGDAMKAVVAGKKITKLEWKNKDEYCFLRGTFLHVHRVVAGVKEMDHQWVVSEGDLIGEDWIVV